MSEPPMSLAETGHFKDAILDRLAEGANVAQFVSFSPKGEQRFARIKNFAPNHEFGSLEKAVDAIIKASPEGSVNIRSFQPDFPKSREFIFGETSPSVVVQHVRRMTGEGLYTIVNETVSLEDGGVSGVSHGDIVEFAPEDTPRCVEKPGTVSLNRRLARDFLETVYGFRPKIPEAAQLRVEFSLHPLRRGFRGDHTIIWEVEEAESPTAEAVVSWPNRFSRFIGDKAFGLLIAHLIGLDVPFTTVIARKVAPFSFGKETGSKEVWIRTCPVEQTPGKYTTSRGWLDPFRLLAEEDPEGEAIASVLCQNGVEAEYSGVLACSREEAAPIIEGVRGRGDPFMSGESPPQDLPSAPRESVLGVYRKADRALGAVRFEWVYDGQRTWTVQLHRGEIPGNRHLIYPGLAEKEHSFDVRRGLEELRDVIERAKENGHGIVLVGEIGITSHMGDVLRKAKVPSRIELPQRVG